jgi:catechol 2,3-dioxygenase-like lactoylglutathione lyase family enzyme
VLTDRWDVGHICISVGDLDAAMVEYSQAFGIAWSPLMAIEPHTVAGSDLYDEGVKCDGLRTVLSTNTPRRGHGGSPSALLELAHADRACPAFALWGCPDGRHYVHHIAYYVDDIEAESKHLSDHGFARELYLPREDPANGVAYHVSEGGVRIELTSSVLKPALIRFVTTGDELDLPLLSAGESA